MLSTEDFTKRANQLFESCRERWKKKLQKGLPKGVTLDLSPDAILPFTRREFQAWLWRDIGLQAKPCRYCRTPIDVISMQLDHKTPLRRGGGPELSNLQCLCERCNRSKGEFTHEEYVLLVEFMEGQGSYLRGRLEGVLIMGGLGNQMKNFPRKKPAGPKKPKVKQSAMAFEQMGAF